MTSAAVRHPRILVVDRNEELARKVGELVDDLEPRPTVEACIRTSTVREVVAHEGPFDLVLAGPSTATRAGIARLESLRAEWPGQVLMMTFTRRPDASLRDLVRVGAVDILQLPIEDKVVLEAIERALALSRVGELPASSGASSSPPGRGTVFTISSATGGCGKTFYATNLAYFLNKHTGRSACIVDLDLQFGEVSTALRLRPRYTIYDALHRGDEDTDLVDHMHEYVIEHETGVSVLAAPKDPSEADTISPPDVTRVIQALRSRFDYVVVDTPAALSEVVLAAFDLSDALYVMATLDLPSVRNMSVFLSTLDRLKIPSEGVNLILNKAEKDVGIDVPQVTKLFAQGFCAVLPYAREVSRSINLGMPVMASMPQAEVSRLMHEAMAPLLPDEDRRRLPAVTAPAAKRRWFGRRREAAA